jgi:hypothetical protein
MKSICRVVQRFWATPKLDEAFVRDVTRTDQLVFPATTKVVRPLPAICIRPTPFYSLRLTPLPIARLS